MRRLKSADSDARRVARNGAFRLRLFQTEQASNMEEWFDDDKFDDCMYVAYSGFIP